LCEANWMQGTASQCMISNLASFMNCDAIYYSYKCVIMKLIAPQEPQSVDSEMYFVKYRPYWGVLQMKCALLLITVAARLKAWTVFARSTAGSMPSNSTEVMDVCMVCNLFCVCVFCVDRGLAKGSSPSKESCRLYIGSRKWKSGWGPTKGCRTIIIIMCSS
jgi:hypothetical protein